MSKSAEELRSRATAFDFDEFDWDEYDVHRPTYPEALYDMIYDHHGTSGEWKKALDVGSGGGQVARVLVEKFNHVVYSDASAAYVEQARRKYANEAKTGKMTFLHRRCDEFDGERDFPGVDGPVDLITAGTCIHFADPVKVMNQLAPLLRSGGTAAIFCYGASPIIPPDDPAAALVRGIKGSVLEFVDKNIVRVNQIPATGTGQARYDNIVLDPAVWTDIRRIQSLRHEPQYPEWVLAAPSVVKPTESIEDAPDDFFTRTIDYKWLEGYLRNFTPGIDISKVAHTELEELKVLMGEREVTARWALILLLATKK